MNNEQTNSIQQIALQNLLLHPDNPNRMSKPNFAKLVRNIERTGRYEPLVVRPHPTKNGCFQIINGEHRCKALSQLNYKTADCLVWNIDEKQAELLLMTLNRLSGSDELAKKLALLKRLNKKLPTAELAKLLPQTAKQIERLGSLKIPNAPAKPDKSAKCFANPLVFFVSDAQQEIIKKAISIAIDSTSPSTVSSSGRSNRSLQKQNKNEKTQAEKRAAALTRITEEFVNKNTEVGSQKTE